MGPRFKIAQDKEGEFSEMQENEVASIEDQVVRPDLHVSDNYFEVCKGLLYHVKNKSGGNECMQQLLVPQPFRRMVWDISHSTPIGGHFG